MNPPATISVTTAHQIKPAENDALSIASNETIVACANVTAGGSEVDSRKSTILAFCSLLGCALKRPKAPRPTIIEMPQIATSQSTNESHAESPTVSTIALFDESGSVRHNPASFRNSDATYLDISALGTSLAMPQPRAAYDPGVAANLMITETPSLLCATPLYRNITPERPQPLDQTESWILDDDFFDASNRMTIVVDLLPWGAYAFMAPFDLDSFVFMNLELRLRGSLRGVWTVKEFVWEREALAFVRVHEERLHYRASVGFPRACICMDGPDPKANRIANQISDARRAALLRNGPPSENKWIFHTPPPPPPSPENLTLFPTEGDPDESHTTYMGW
ncbi:hypothetical protein B0H12DRAFT_1242409 [Mycena haematopus]|nr:hypothetical protein B0H12DRAFT_1242409 [Mycena haematopus]